MRRPEVNYFRWNTEARAMLLGFALVFILPAIVGVVGFHRTAAAIFAGMMVAMMLWNFTYLYRAGEQKRRRLEFVRIWGRQDGQDRRS